MAATICEKIWKPLPPHLKTLFGEVSFRFSLHIGLAFFVDGPTISYLISATADVNEQLKIPIMRKGGLVDLVGCEPLGWRNQNHPREHRKWTNLQCCICTRERMTLLLFFEKYMKICKHMVNLCTTYFFWVMQEWICDAVSFSHGYCSLQLSRTFSILTSEVLGGVS